MGASIFFVLQNPTLCLPSIHFGTVKSFYFIIREMFGWQREKVGRKLSVNALQRMDKKSKKEKRVFEKHKQKQDKNEKIFFQFFSRQSFGQKKAPAGRRTAPKKKFLKNIGKGDIKKGSAKGTEKKWSLMVSLYRPWQDPIGQGHGEWNGNRERLYGMAMGLRGKARSWPKQPKVNQKH